MLNHLLKRCPNMTQEDRNLAFFHMQHTSNGTGKSKKQTATGRTNQQEIQQPLSLGTLQVADHQSLPNDYVSEHRQQQPQQMPQMMHQSSQEAQSADMPLQMLMQRQRSALDTLAEVSRRHMDYSIHSNDYTMNMHHSTMPRQADRGLVEHALLAALQQHETSDGIVPRSVQPPAIPMYPTYVAQAQAGAEQAAFSEVTVPLPPVQTAPTVTHQMDQCDFGPGNASIDPQLDEPTDDNDTIVPIQDHEAQQQPQEDFIAWTEGPQGFATQQEPPTNEPNPEFAALHKSDKTNARARFTDTRRKEVQEIRKRGACMRCRMLKKPCSEGTPCGTCKKVDSARLWKGTCLRTKLAEEFTLYSTSYFHSQMVGKLADTVQSLNCIPLLSGIQVKLISRPNLTITLGAKHYISATSTETIDAISHLNETANAAGTQATLVLDDETTSQKLSDYCMSDVVLQHCIETEKSVFIKATLQEAISLLELERSQERPFNAKPGPRTNHISPSVLLSNVIELWIETNMLVYSSQASLEIRHMPPSQNEQHVAQPVDTSQPALPVYPESTSYGLIRAQILAAIETACHRLSRAVMNELERRLLQRQQVSTFATFISAVVLFSCIERITSFYHSLNLPPPPPPSTSPNSRSPSYPTTIPAPSSLWPQGPHFARLLTTLLRMRAFPPKTTRTTDNKLAVLREPALPVRLNGVAVRGQQDAETTRAANWLDPLGLDIDFLRTRRDGDVADVSWEMKFVSAVLLDEGM
jgi:hypothetical protein